MMLPSSRAVVAAPSPSSPGDDAASAGSRVYGPDSRVAPEFGMMPVRTPSEILIDLHDSLSDAEVRALDAEYSRPAGAGNSYPVADALPLRLNSPQSEDERLYVARVAPVRQADLLERLRRDPRVEYAEPNWVYHLIDPSPVNEVLPSAQRRDAPQRRLPAEVDDPLFSKQWSLPMIGVPRAWAHADGEGVVVAVIDTGVAFEDRKQFRRVEDLDGDRFVTGYDFLKDDEHPNDDHGHGTHVAGTIAQTTNNRLGVAGVAPRAKIMPLKVLSKRGAGTAGDIADAIRFAADEGAHIMNLSLGGGPRSLIMEAAVRYARTKGAMVVCAAGNGGRAKVEFPAAYVGAFAVSSVGPDRKLAYYSSYGRQVDVAGPGGNKQLGEHAGVLQNTITPVSLDKTDTYLSFQGTSMAAPHVAGVAALVMSAGVRDVTEVERILRETAVDAGPQGWDERYGYGVVDAARAVEAALARGRTARPAGASQDLAAAPPVEPTIARAPSHALTDPADRRPALRTALEALLLAWGWIGLVLARVGRGALRRLALPALGGALVAVLLVAAPGLSIVRWAPWQSALPVLGAALLLLQVRGFRPVLFGAAAGWAVALAVQVPLPGADVAGIPGVAGLWDRAWLLLQTALLVVLTHRLLLSTLRDRSRPGARSRG